MHYFAIKGIDDDCDSRKINEESFENVKHVIRSRAQTIIRIIIINLISINEENI